MLKKILGAFIVFVFTVIGFAPFPTLAAKAKISVLNLKARKGIYGPILSNDGVSRDRTGQGGGRK